jgi:hypothetical protein
MRNVLAILTAFVLFGLSFHLSSCKSCKNKPTNRCGDDKVSSPDQNSNPAQNSSPAQNPPQDQAQKSNQKNPSSASPNQTTTTSGTNVGKKGEGGTGEDASKGSTPASASNTSGTNANGSSQVQDQNPDQNSNQNSNPDQNPPQARQALTPEEDIERRIVVLAQENMSSANQPWERALAKANSGFVRAMLAKDGAEAIAARKDVWAASEEAGRMNKTREGRQIEREISAMYNIIQAEIIIDLKKSVSSIESYAERIATSIVHETIRAGAGGGIDMELKLAMVEIRWLLQVAQVAAKTGDAKSAEHVESINEKLAELDKRERDEIYQ